MRSVSLVSLIFFIGAAYREKRPDANLRNIDDRLGVIPLMPNCFQLLRGGVAVSLEEVDEEMCRHFDVPCDPDRYLESWFDVIGCSIAMGRSWAEIDEMCAKYYSDVPFLARIANWIEERFEVRCWYEQKGYPRSE